jgi:branched-chain amino acid transport system substrate-binding protein
LRGFAVLLTVAVFAACENDSVPIVIATAGPWLQPNGASHKRGVELAVAEINAAGGIGGRKVELIERDDDGTGTRAAAIAQEFVGNDSILAVVGHVNSGAMVSAARVYDGHLPAVSSTASSPDLTGVSSWVFRVIASDSVTGAQLARFAGSLGARRAGVLYENNAFGRGLAEPFRRHYPGTLIAFDPVPSDGRADVEPYVAYLKQSGADLVFVAGSEGSGLALLREAKRQGFAATLLGGVGWTGIVADTAASEGAFVGVPFAAGDARPIAQRFVNAFRARFGREPDAKAALAYDATRVVARAIAEGGTSRSRVRDWLADLHGGRAFDGVTGRVQFDSTGDVLAQSIVMTQARQGALVAAGGEASR